MQCHERLRQSERRLARNSNLATGHQAFNKQQVATAFYVFSKGQNNETIYREFKENFAGRFDIDRNALDDSIAGHFDTSTHKHLRQTVTHMRTEQLKFAADEGICFLTRVDGDFDGFGEGARVFRRDGQWLLRVKSDCVRFGRRSIKPVVL